MTLRLVDSSTPSPDHPGSTAASTEGAGNVDPQDSTQGRCEGRRWDLAAEGQASPGVRRDQQQADTEARAKATRADLAAIQAARNVEDYRLALTISTGLEEERVHREEGYRIQAAFTRLRQDLALMRQEPIECEVSRETFRLMRLGRWDYAVLVPHRFVPDLYGYYTRVKVYAAPPEREVGT